MNESNERQERAPAGVSRLLGARTAPLDLDGVTRSVLDATASLGAIGAVIILVSDAGAVASMSLAGASEGIATSLGPLALSKRYPLIIAAREGRPLWLPSRAAAQAQFPEFASGMSASQAIADLPLIRDGRVIGAVGIPFAEPRSFSDVDRAYLLTVAELAAEALAVDTGDTAPSQPDAALLDRLHDAVIVIDHDTGSVVYANAAANRLSGLDGHELIGAAAIEVRDRLVVPDDPFRELDLATLPWGTHLVRMQLAEDVRLIELHVSEVDDRHRQAVVATDVTDRSETDGVDRRGDGAERVARELHDRAVQAVFATSMGLAALAQAVRPELRPQVEALLAELDEVVERARTELPAG